MFYAPRHVQPFARPAVGDVDIPGRFAENHKLWKIACLCDADLFDLYVSDLPRAVARCMRCAKEIVLYDIREYPAGTPYRGASGLRRALVSAVNGCAVYAMYEYGDIEEGAEPNPDDISWCQIFARDASTGEVTMVVDDEAA
jgi:hypothetical protein